MTSQSLVPATRAWRETRRNVLSRDRGVCQIQIPGICRVTATEVDHYRPLVEGGDVYAMDNLRAACRPCNAHLGGKLGAKRKKSQRKWSRQW